MSEERKIPWFLAGTSSIEMLRKIPNDLTMLLRGMVVAQDHGYALAEALSEAKFEQTFIDRICVAVHNERLKMVAGGWDVYAPPEETEAHFQLGLEPYPFKEPRLDKPSTISR